MNNSPPMPARAGGFLCRNYYSRHFAAIKITKIAPQPLLSWTAHEEPS